jgi:putative phosphotransacetylase
MEITVGVSNRHVHLNEESYKELFGDAPLECIKEINQPGQFSSNQKVTIKTEKGEIENIRILGPLRIYNQVEISKTDAFKLGLNPPVRDSGDLAGSERITLVGPNGEIVLEEGCIIATRHIHINPSQIQEFGFEGMTKVKVKLNGQKGGIIDNVYLKVAEQSFFELHIDTDDGNSHLVNQGDVCTIITDNDN